MKSLPSYLRIFAVILALTVLGFGIAAGVLLKQQFRSPAQPSVQTVTQTEELDISVCDPANGPFSLTIDNSFFPLSVGKVFVYESETEKIRMTVLDETEVVAGVTTRVVEEREWNNNALAEVSRNFFVAAPDGTVCYYGEDVDIYENDQVVGHEGAWRAGDGENKPGIQMPANPVVGQEYQQEIAPGVATDMAKHVSLETSYTTPAGTFGDVLVVKETPASSKRYARGIGMIFDDGAVLKEK